MAETYVVKITTQAQEQMQKVTHYIASELKAPDAVNSTLLLLGRLICFLKQ